MAAQVLRLARDEKLELPPVAQRNQRVQLDAQASATVLAFCKDEDMSLSAALNFIVNDWAALKLAALRAASFDCGLRSSAQDARQEAVKVG